MINRKEQFKNLYLHVPFCSSKCDYCSFYSVDHISFHILRKWLDTMKMQIISHGEYLQNLNTVYIGGGTPTFLPEKMLEEFLICISQNVSFHGTPSWSIEANPDTISRSKAEILKRYVTRISIGVQSFHQDLLHVLGRKSGDLKQVVQSVDICHSAGLQNIGIDLIYAIPGQTVQQWADDVHFALTLAPKHLSAYSLIYEPGTPMTSRSNLSALDDSAVCTMRDVAEEILKDANMPRYEISNYAQKAWEAEHNQNIWHGESYLGLGPSACSFDGEIRWTEPSSLDSWLRGNSPGLDEISRDERIREIFIMGLRTVRGWNNIEFQNAIHDSKGWYFLLPKMDVLIKEKLMTVSNDNVRLTARGLELWDSVAEFLL